MNRTCGLLLLLFIACPPLFSAEGEMPEAEAICRKGYQLLENNQPTEALTLFDKALAVDPEYGRAYFLKGLVYSHQGKLSSAIKEYKKSIRFEPDSPNSHMNLGLSYLYREQPDKAIAAFRVAYELAPENPDICFNLAICHASREDYAMAWWYIERGQKMDANIDPRFIKDLAAKMPKPKELPARREGFSVYFLPAGSGGGFRLKENGNLTTFPTAGSLVKHILKMKTSARKNGIWLVVTHPDAYAQKEKAMVLQLEKLAIKEKMPFFICRGKNLPRGWYRAN